MKKLSLWPKKVLRALRESLNKARCAVYWRYNRVKFKISDVRYGNNFNVQGRVYIDKKPSGVISIGDNCVIKSGNNLNPLSRNIRTAIYVEENAKLIVGNNCGFSSVCLWADKSILIGNNVSIGADSIIMDSDAHSLSYLDRRSVRQDVLNKNSRSIIIGDDVLIGTRCIILKGVTIGKRCVIGSGSIITKDIPDDCIAAGNPAKVIRKLGVTGHQ